MAEIVNLRRARKQRERASAEKRAEQNRVAFGRSKAERKLADAEREQRERALEGHRLPDPGGSDEPSR